jgi:hypothetical protein
MAESEETKREDDRKQRPNETGDEREMQLLRLQTQRLAITYLFKRISLVFVLISSCSCALAGPSFLRARDTSSARTSVFSMYVRGFVKIEFVLIS